MTKKKIEDDLDEIAYYLDGKGKMHFTKSGHHHFTRGEREQLKGLYGQLGEKFSEISLTIAFNRGYAVSKIEGLSDEEWASLEVETEQAIDDWDTADVDDDLPDLSALTPLQALLGEHHALGEKILNIQDTAIQRELGNDEEEDDAD